MRGRIPLTALAALTIAGCGTADSTAPPREKCRGQQWYSLKTGEPLSCDAPPFSIGITGGGRPAMPY